THPEITRFFMTIPEAASLVIQAGSMGTGGDVFVLDMGAPVKIRELAEKMVLLSGLTLRTPERPDGDIAIEYVGLRPGEKLYEELLIGDNVTPTPHPMIMRASENRLDWETLKTVLDSLSRAITDDNYPAIREVFEAVVDGYHPESAMVDWIHLHHSAACVAS
ncbi:MAG TPA: polysaccharide biosynthesis protein, partial [Burkholderiaceae bacterium]|nr:polysaccharide biosynthesis protein [Burkholderiaceae bacterium]